MTRATQHSLAAKEERQEQVLPSVGGCKFPHPVIVPQELPARTDCRDAQGTLGPVSTAWISSVIT